MNQPKKGLCPNCTSNPSIEFLKNIVHIKCQCGHESVKKFKDYFSLIKDIQCNSNIDTPELNAIQKKIMKAQNHILDYFLYVKKQTIGRLEKEIENIEKEYQAAYSRNSEILALLSTLIANYDGSEIMHDNIIKNSNIEIYDCPDEKDCYQYLINYHVIKTKDSNIKEIKPLKEVKLELEATSIILLQDGRVAGCAHGDIYVFDPKNNYNLDMKFRVQYAETKGLCQLENGLVVSSGRGHIKLFALQKDKAECVFTIEEAHSSGLDGTINSIIALPGNKFASCSDDKTVKIWSGEQPYTDIAIEVLDSDCYARAVVYMKEHNYILVGMSNSIAVWSNESYELKRSLKGVNNPITQIDTDRVMCRKDEQLYIVNVEKGNVELCIKDEVFNDIYSMIKLKDVNAVIVGMGDGEFCVLDLDTYDYVIHKGIHKSIVYDLIPLNDGMFYSSSLDYTIKLNKYILNEKK